MSTLALYVQGDIYPSQNTDPAAVVAAITGSKLTTPILALCHVNCSTETCPNGQSPPGSEDGDLTFNDTLIVRGGQYVGDSTWPGIISSLRAGQSQAAAMHRIYQLAFGNFFVGLQSIDCLA